MRWALSDKGSIGVDDLIALGRPLVGTIRLAEEAEVFGGQHGLVIYFNECKKPFVPCLTVRKILARIMPPSLEEWKGIVFEIYVDDQVNFGGGVRIRAASCLKKPLTTHILASRGRRVPMTINPLNVQPKEGKK